MTLLERINRPKAKFIQLCLDLKNVRNPYKTMKFPCWVSRKYDGCFALAWRNREGVHIYSRTGERYVSMKHLEDFMKPFMQVDTILIFEAYVEGVPQNVISGWCRDTKQQHPELKAYCHDWLTLEEFQAENPMAYGNRYARVCLLSDIDPLGNFCVPVEQKYCPSLKVAMGMLKQTIEDGGEGLVLRDEEAAYHPGARDISMVKMKGTITYDLRVVGVEEGRGKFLGMAGALQVAFFDGENLSVGSGLTDSERKAIWEDPQKYIGQIVEVEAMRASAKGKLREPRFKDFRTDKEESDVELDLREGNLNLYGFLMIRGESEAIVDGQTVTDPCGDTEAT